MKKLGLIAMALALVVGLTQCKKETNSDAETNGVFITLNVSNGSRVAVDPTHGGANDYATVTWEDGDVLYVGNNGAYCGYLTYGSSKFSGTIDDPTSTDDYLHFYFMGNKGTTSEPTSVNITDQTSKYPVIMYGHSEELYSSGTTSYTATLKNKCAIVKFTTTDIDADITVSGMNNTVTVNFGANKGATTGDPYSFSKAGQGNIKLHKESNTERWAILLPQEAVADAKANATGYTGTGVSVPVIAANGYYTNEGAGYTVTLTNTLPEGATSGLFTINSNGDQVRFSKGNLQYQASGSTWRFAENQYDYVGDATNGNVYVGETKSNNASVSSTYAGWIDLFGWATSGYSGATTSDNTWVNYQPWATSNGAGSVNTSTNYYEYGPSTSNIASGTSWNDASHYDTWSVCDWGHNAISNGGNTADTWRTLTSAEWVWILGPSSGANPGTNCRSTETVNSTENARFTYATINSTYKGMIIFPDGYSGGTPDGVTWGDINNYSNYTTTCTTAGWSSLEGAGCVFLPAAGYRNGATVSYAGSNGYYWSSTACKANNAYYVSFFFGNFYPRTYDGRYYGNSVRLVVGL